MTKFLVGLEKFLHSLTHSFYRHIVKTFTFLYLFLKQQKVLHLFCRHTTIKRGHPFGCPLLIGAPSICFANRPPAAGVIEKQGKPGQGFPCKHPFPCGRRKTQHLFHQYKSRRSKLHIACSDFFYKKVRVRSFRCSSFSIRKRCAGLRVEGTGVSGWVHLFHQYKAKRNATLTGGISFWCTFDLLCIPACGGQSMRRATGETSEEASGSASIRCITWLIKQFTA